MSFKYGRKDPSNTPAIPFRAIYKTGVTIPPHPTSVDYLQKYGSWNMLGNDQYGDCVAVTWANERRVLTAGAHYPDFNAVIKLYKTQNPGFPNQDDGMDIQQCLSYLNKTGGPDGVKAIAFAKVDYTNLEEVKAALAIFGVVWVGINVQQAQMSQFDAGQPWDYVAGSPLDGGHSVVSGGYNGTVGNDVRFVTWGQETGFTDNFWKHQVEEAWVVIWPEHLTTEQFQAGVDANALAVFYKDLTGRDLPIPVTPVPPGPAPVPPPAPSPTPEPPSPLDPAVADSNLALAYRQLKKSSRNSRAGKLIAQWLLDRNL